MLFGFRTITFRQYPIEHALRIISKSGYDGVELCFENEELKPSSLQPSRIGETKHILKDSHLEISATSLHSDFVADERNFEDYLKAIRLTEEFESNIFIIAPGYVLTLDKKALRKKLENRLSLLLSEAEKRGIVLALEPEPAMIIENCKEALEITKAIGFKNLKMNFDIGHFHCVGDSIESSLKLLKDYVVHTHFEDIRGRVHRHLIPGDGEIDFKRILKTLQEISYKGFATVDLFDVSDQKKAAEDSISHLKSIILNPEVE